MAGYGRINHLGNVRVTFSEKKSGAQYKATLENDRQTIEQAAFRNLQHASIPD
jgi:hypothetical protein